MEKKLQKGFTLIELLVVVAIIGILASVVLASLNQARSKGADAAIKSNLANLRPQAEIYYDNNGNYGAAVTACNAGMFADPSMVAGVTAAGSNACQSTGTAWAISAPLSTGSDWCVDSTGVSKVGVAIAGVCI